MRSTNTGLRHWAPQSYFGSPGRFYSAPHRHRGLVHASVNFAPVEMPRTLFGYAPSAPAAAAVTGRIGAVNYDVSTHRFTAEVMPGPDGTASVELWVTCQQG